MTNLRTAVHSSLVASIGYASDASLEIEFRNGTVYRYFAVPESVHTALLAADSIGEYFNRHVRPRFPCARVAP